MGIKYPFLANICGLPLPMPVVDTKSESVLFEQPISRHFSRQVIVIAGIGICFLVLFVYFFSPYITGLKHLSPNRRNGQLYLIFYLSLLLIPYFGWQIAMVRTNQKIVRRVVITKGSKISINGQALSNAILNRGRVIIKCANQKRKIEAIWVQSGKRSYLIAARDLPADLDQIEVMIPIKVSYVETETEMKGVL